MNVFISYCFEDDLRYKELLSVWLKGLSFSNYSLSVTDRTDHEILREIYTRSWSFSVIIVLIGKQTAQSNWIGREIDECMKVDNSLKASASRRVRKPKGVLAIELPDGLHEMPKVIADNLLNHTAVYIKWADIICNESLRENLLLAQKRRSSTS